MQITELRIRKVEDEGKAEAKRIVAMMRKKGLNAYYTNGKSANSFNRSRQSPAAKSFSGC